MNHHIGDTNEMSDTPISDSTPHNVADLGMQIRRLEREFNAANARIKRLEEAGIELRECASWVGHACCQYVDQIRRAKAAIEAWDKEAKL